MKWKVVLISLLILVISLSLSYFGIVPIDIGIVVSIASFTTPYVLYVIDYLLKPKASLTIGKPQLIKEEHGHVKGYKIRTRITNEGKKIVSDLIPSIRVEDRQKKSAKLLNIYLKTITVLGKTTVEEVREEALENDYMWIDKKERTHKGIWEKLRHKDHIDLIFPQRSHPHIGWSQNVQFSTMELLKLEPNTNYYVTITIKGEDSKKVTVIKSETFKIQVPL